ncbi:MAG TPA: substrate-binding domain-containing protein [Verrucomicrobiae bacterium]|nr:substrate-binding domain-containing protein [Verrucomicrobiae bacterium]
MKTPLGNHSRRSWLKNMALAGTGGCLASCRQGENATSAPDASKPKADYSNEEYVWISPHANLPLYKAHDHPALELAGKELGVKITITGPSTLDMPMFVSMIETTVARRPAGMLISAWDPSVVIAPIATAFEAQVPVVTVDVDAPTSKRLTFVGTNWFDLGVRQGEAMARALAGKKGRIALLGLTEQYIDQQAFAGFRSVIEKEGLTAMEPQHDRGDSAVAARVASALIQSTPDLVGMAGFDSESGPGIGLAVKEAGKVSQIIVTCVDAEPVHLNLIKEGVVTAAIGQKRELFTYLGLRVLFDLNHSPLKFTANDRKAGVFPAPEVINTGSYTVTRENVDVFLKAG